MTQREIRCRAWNRISKSWEVFNAEDGCSFRYEGMRVYQDTGLKDRNGKEIWEGSIVHCTAGMYALENTFQTDEKKVVTFEGGAFRYDGITLGDMLDANMREYTFEVIGDIYENPELLQSKDKDV